MLRGSMTNRAGNRSAKQARAPKAAPRRIAAVSEPDEVVRLRFSVPSTHAGIRDGVRRVMKAALEMHCIKSDRANVEIALREALANAAFHGNGGDPSKSIQVRCALGPRRGITVAVRDHGVGFDPAEIPDPREQDRLFLHHGRGLLLMRALMDRVEHRHGGREVVLHKGPPARSRSAAARPGAASKGR
jgi:serine/threonine-protein kinase RsbW